MFKFLLYLFLFYVIFRFIFGVLFKGIIRSKVIHFEKHTFDQHHNSAPHPDGKVVVEKPASKQQKDDKNIGEYVDYEEVK